MGVIRTGGANAVGWMQEAIMARDIATAAVAAFAAGIVFGMVVATFAIRRDRRVPPADRFSRYLADSVRRLARLSWHHPVSHPDGH